MSFQKIQLFLVVCLLAGSGAAQDVSSAPRQSRPLTLADAISLTLTRNPALAAYPWEIRAAEARGLQASLRPNPELSLEVEDLRLGSAAGTATKSNELTVSKGSAAGKMERATEKTSGSAFSEAQVTLSLSQVVELGGKRAARMRLAAQERDVAAWDYEVARADVLKEVTVAFTEVVAAQDAVKLNEDLVRLAESVASTVKERVQAGRVSPVEATKAETALASERVRAAAATRTLEGKRIALAAFWGDESPRFDRAEGALAEVKAPAALAEAQGRILRNPDLVRWRAEVAKRQSAVDVEKTKAKPDVTLSGGFRAKGVAHRDTRGFGLGSDGLSMSRSGSDARDSWENGVVLGVSIPLPLNNRNQGSIAEAEHLVSQAREQQRAAEFQLRTRLAEANQAVLSAYAAIVSLRDEVLPSATRIFEATNEAYKQGRFGYLDVLDAQRTLFDARQQYLDALLTYHQTTAEMERMTGEPLPASDQPSAVAAKEN